MSNKKYRYDEKFIDGVRGRGGGGFTAVFERGADETLLQRAAGGRNGHYEGDGGGHCGVQIPRGGGQLGGEVCKGEGACRWG